MVKSSLDSMDIPMDIPGKTSFSSSNSKSKAPPLPNVIWTCLVWTCPCDGIESKGPKIRCPN